MRERAWRPPSPAAAARLKWPAQLDPARFEAYCAAYLRGQGWQVEPARSALSDDVFLEASGPQGRLLLLCQPRAERVSAMSVRSVAVVAEEFAAAGPVLLTRGKLLGPAAQAAARHGVTVLTPAELPGIARAARPMHDEPAEPEAKAPDAQVSPPPP